MAEKIPVYPDSMQQQQQQQIPPPPSYNYAAQQTSFQPPPLHPQSYQTDYIQTNVYPGLYLQFKFKTYSFTDIINTDIIYRSSTNCLYTSSKFGNIYYCTRW